MRMGKNVRAYIHSIKTNAHTVHTLFFTVSDHIKRKSIKMHSLIDKPLIKKIKFILSTQNMGEKNDG